jgi:hypothetical protein
MTFHKFGKGAAVVYSVINALKRDDVVTANLAEPMTAMG